MQWYGGLGIVILSLAIMVRPGLTAKRLSLTGPPEDDLVGGTRAHARRVLIVYLLLTAGGYLLFVVLGGGLWNGLLYILPAVSTGGFAPVDGSLAEVGGLALGWVVLLTCVAGALPLAVYHRARRRGPGAFTGDLQVQLVVLALLVSTVATAACFHWLEGMSWSETARHAPAMAISAQTTAGFSSLETGTLGPASRLVLILAMTLGGGAGSTAGGIKLIRLLILLGIIRRVLRSMSAAPRTVLTTRVRGHQVTDGEVQDALMVMLLFAITVTLSWLPFLACGHDPLDALFEVVSATGTVGLSSGVTSTTLPVGLKLVLCADMLLGRLELIAWLVLLYPRTWIGRRRTAG
jgi:trk system potassium uptake protein TrkH